jgi:toxin FitB
MPGARSPAVDAPLVVDSSCWLEYLGDTSRAGLFASALELPEVLIVPVITVYEVFKVAKREFGARRAAEAVSLMRRGHVIGIDLTLAVAAVDTGLPLADSLIYATAQAHNAALWTQDAHFEGLPGVKYFAK